MLGQSLESNVIPENLIISVIQEDVEKLSREKSQQHSEATRLRKSLASILEVSKDIEKKGFGRNSVYLKNVVGKAHFLLDQYLKDVNGLLSKIEEAKSKSQIEQLKLSVKIERILDVVDGAVKYVTSIKNYPYKIYTEKDLEQIQTIFDELEDLPEKIKDVSKTEHKSLEQEIARDFSVARDKRALTPVRLLLIPKIKDEERKAAEQRIYFMDEKGLEDHLDIILKNFISERNALISEIEEWNDKRNKDGYVPIKITMEHLVAQIKETYARLSMIMLAFVHDVKNLMIIYKNHLDSTINLNIDLTMDEADKLRELEVIIKLIEKFTDQDMLIPLMSKLNSLNELKSKFLVFAKYDYKRDVFIDKKAVSNMIKAKASSSKQFMLKVHDVEFKTGAKAKVRSFKITVPGARGRIRGDIFIRDPNYVPRKAIVVTIGFLTYRQLYYNMCQFLAADGYLVLLHDLPSQGESRGKYGFAEASQNVLILCKYLKSNYKVEAIGFLGHSLGGLVALFALCHYDLEVDEVVRRTRLKFAKFWSDVNNMRWIDAIKSRKDALESEMKELEGEFNQEIGTAIAKSYARWNVPIKTVGIMNSALLEMKEFFGLKKQKFLLYLMLSRKLFGVVSEFDILATLANGFDDIERTQEVAFKRLLRMNSKDKKRYKELQKVNPLFRKGFSVFDRDQFFQECAYGITPLQYLRNIEDHFPQALQEICSVPKLFMYTTGDSLANHEGNNNAIVEYARRFKNCYVAKLSGLNHELNYKPADLIGKLLGKFKDKTSEHSKSDSTLLNYIHYYFKYRL